MEKRVIAPLVFARMPGQMPECAAPVCHWPPRSSEASRTPTSKPRSASSSAVAMPAGPPPMTAIRASLGRAVVCMPGTVPASPARVSFEVPSAP